MSKYVEWHEPYFDQDGEELGDVTLRVSVETAIAARKAMVRDTDFTYDSDEQALDDFLIVHYGVIVEG